MDTSEKLLKVVEIIRKNNGLSEIDINLESTLKEDLGLDSLRILELSSDCESMFNIPYGLLDKEVEKWIRVEDIINSIESL